MNKIIQIIHRQHTEHAGQYDHIYLYENGEVWNYRSWHSESGFQVVWVQLPNIPNKPLTQ